MKLYALVVSLSLLLAGPVAAVPQSDTLVARADANAHTAGTAEQFLAKVDNLISLARRGEYGPLKRGGMEQVLAARQEIEILLQGRERATDLETADRIKLFNAKELITSVLRSDEKSRKVCRRSAETGTRLAKTECLTVAQREARAVVAQQRLKDFQSHNCRPGAPLSATDNRQAPC